MKEGLLKMKDATERKDFKELSQILKQLDPVFRQHIADEEAQILRLLVAELGREGAEAEIKVFQQHRPIYRLMRTIAELAPKGADDLETEQAKLGELFEDHASAEEQRVFPRALGLTTGDSGGALR